MSSAMSTAMSSARGPSPTATAELLQRYLDEVSANPSAWCWSRNNCCHFAGRWVLLATGHDCLGGLADVADARAARRVLARLGTGTLRCAVSQRLRRAPVAAALAQVGDLVLLPVAGDTGARAAGLLGAALGVCVGRAVAGLGRDGALRRSPLALGDAAWPLFARPTEATALADQPACVPATTTSTRQAA